MRPSGGIRAGRLQGPGQLPPASSAWRTTRRGGSVPRLTRISEVRTNRRTPLQSEKARVLSATISREAVRSFVSSAWIPSPGRSRNRRMCWASTCRTVGLGRDRCPQTSGKGLRSKQRSRKQKKAAVARDRTGAQANSFNDEKAVSRLASQHPRHPPGLPAQVSWRKPSRF